MPIAGQIPEPFSFGRCVAWCGQDAEALVAGAGEDRMVLAARIFATLEPLALEFPPADVDAAFDGKGLRVACAEIPAVLRACEREMPATQLDKLAACLLALDASFCDAAMSERVAPMVVQLDGPVDTEFRSLCPGVVRCAVLPASGVRRARWAREQSDQATGPPPRPLYPRDSLRWLSLYRERTRFIVDLVEDRRGCVGSKAAWSDGCLQRASDPGLRVALSWLPCGDAAFHTCYELTASNRGFDTSPMHPVHGEDALVRRVRQVLDAALAARVSLLMLPELAVSGKALAAIAEWLRLNQAKTAPFFKVLAGSFHVRPAGGAPLRNEAPLLQRDASVLFRTAKNGCFSMSASAVRRAFSAGIFRGTAPATLPSSISEHVEPGDRLWRWRLPFAELSVLISEDLVDRRPEQVLHTLKRVRPDLVLWPCRSPETDRFPHIVDELFEDGVGVLMVNDARACRDGGFLALASLPLPEVPKAPPVRVGWRKGERAPVFWSDGTSVERGWSPLSHPSVTPLGDDLGMVIDLSAQIAAP